MTSTHRYCPHCGATCSPVAHTCFACRHSLLVTPLLAPYPEDFCSLPQKRETFTPGTLIKQQYRLLKVVGQGGFGTVYQATDLLTTRTVAVKVIHLAGLTAQQALEATESFRREVSLLSHLRHTHLPRIFDTFAQASYWYLIMDFIEGETLEDYMLRQQSLRGAVSGGALSLSEVLKIGLQLCQVLDYLHTREPPIIFRDLKPGNVMRTSSGHLFLIDFGIARHFKPERAKDTSPLGSPGYAAPEQYGKAQTTPRADIYSLGALLHYLLTGSDPAETLFHFASLPPEFAQIDRVIRPMLETDERKRPRDVRVVAQALERLKQRGAGEPVSFPAQQKSLHRVSLSRRTVVAGLTTLGVGAVAASVLFPKRASLGVLHPQLLSIYTGHKANVFAMTWSPDGTRIASLDQNNLLHIWNVAQAKRLFVIPLVTTLTNCQPVGIGWSPHSRYVAFCCEMQPVRIRVWDTITGHMQSSYTGPVYATCEGSALAWSPDGTRIVSAGDSGTIHIWYALTGEPIAVHPSSALEQVWFLAWSPNGKYIAGAPTRGPIVVLDAQNGNALFSYHETSADGSSWNTALAWSADGKFLATGVGGNDSMVQVHSSITGKQVATYSGEKSSTRECQVQVSWPSRGLRVASYRYDPERIEVWPVGGERGCSYWSNGPLDVEWSPDGKYLASSNGDNTIWVWKAP